jgi:hypothetical protein
MAQRRVEPQPRVFWYNVAVEVPVMILDFTRQQARERVFEAFGSVAFALGAAGGPTFQTGKPRLRSVKKGPQLVTNPPRAQAPSVAAPPQTSDQPRRTRRR